MFKRVTASLLAGATCLLVLLPVNASAAHAGDQDSNVAASMAKLQRQIDLQLKFVPGGKQIAPNEISYGDGQFIVTYAMPNQSQITGSPDCPSGSFCFYDNVNWGYPRGRLSDKGWQDLATWGWHDRTESVHNNTNTAVDFQNHTVGGHENDRWLFCVNAFGWDANVDPYRNMADHVYRNYAITQC